MNNDRKKIFQEKINILWVSDNPDKNSTINFLSSTDKCAVSFASFEQNLFTAIENDLINTVVVEFQKKPDNFNQRIGQLKEVVRPREIPIIFILPRITHEAIIIVDSFSFVDIIYSPFEFSELFWRLQKMLNYRGDSQDLLFYKESMKTYENQLQRMNDFLTTTVPAFAPYVVTPDEQIDKKISTFLRQLSEGLGAEVTLLLRFSQEEQELILEATPVGPEADRSKATFQFDDEFLAPTAQNFQIRLWKNEDEEEENLFVTKLSKILGYNIDSLIMVPILLEQKLFGIFVVINKITGKYFSPLDESFTQIAANFFAKELHSAEIFKNAANNGNVDDIASPFIARVNAKLEFMHSILDSISFGVIILNHFNQIIYMNKAAERIIERSYKELKDENFANIFGDKVLSDSYIRREEDELKASRYEVELKMPNGEPKLIGFTSQIHKNFMNQPVGRVITLRDISTLLLREKEMLRMDRLATLGILVSGIAHEIRNPLAGIKSVAQALEAHLKEEGHDKSEYVERIIRQVNRLNTLLQALFVYSRPERPTIDDVDIVSVMDDVKPLIEKSLSQKNILYQEYIDQNNKTLPADPNLLQQMLLNLMLNAIDSMENGGVLSISIEKLDVLPHEIANQMSYLQRRMLSESLRIVVSDTGKGISENDLKNIYTPFFTTKDDGTGLGLPIVQQIVENHRGFINVESECPGGTRFSIYLPLSRIIEE